MVYEFDSGVGLQNTVAQFGLDNGIFVWLDGNFLSGQLRPYGVDLGELSINIGNIDPGIHYLQVLREDHGGGTGYATLVSLTTRSKVQNLSSPPRLIKGR